MRAGGLGIAGAMLWAFAFVLSAIVLRGSAWGDWVEGALLVGWIVFLAYRAGTSRGRR